jgi:hypothetical protein
VRWSRSPERPADEAAPVGRESGPGPFVVLAGSAGVCVLGVTPRRGTSCTRSRSGRCGRAR